MSLPSISNSNASPVGVANPSDEMPVERYVPVSSSLISDAPGWGATTLLHVPKQTIEQKSGSSSCTALSIPLDWKKETLPGPICWKCKGTGRVKDKKRKKIIVSKDMVHNIDTQTEHNPNHHNDNKNISNEKMCPICQGRGYILPKKTDVTAPPPIITRKRKATKGWNESGPSAYAVQKMEQFINNNDDNNHQQDIKAWNETKEDCHPLLLLYLANHHLPSIAHLKIGIPVVKSVVGSSTTNTKDGDNDILPLWLPTRPGEQLCNLVGSWRILQRVGSHRWTTDDILTANIAMRQVLSRFQDQLEQVSYLDLGCGNASVLQMVSWGLLEHFKLNAYGIEARSEAVDFARRSLSFNMGPTNNADDTPSRSSISIIHSDFRQLYSSRDNTSSTDEAQDPRQIDHIMNQKFHLVTGTPPYFRVDFHIQKDENNKNVKAAVINQGGMPTSVQSAPARCEYRGGVEAYCAAASQVLADNGVFVVCENWLNDSRVYAGAASAGLNITMVVPVKGKSSRKENLFGVYVMEKKVGDGVVGGATEVQSPLCVRDDNGKWTADYSQLMEQMSIPAFNGAE